MQYLRCCCLEATFEAQTDVAVADIDIRRFEFASLLSAESSFRMEETMEN